VSDVANRGIADTGDAAVALARLLLGDESRGTERSVAGVGIASVVSGARFGCQFLQAYCITSRSSFTSFSSATLSLGEFLTTLETELVEGFHLILTPCFLLISRFGELHDHVHASTFALSSNNLLGLLGADGVGR
jgi:hypothetical protein